MFKKGYKQTEEHKEKNRQTKIGNKNPMFGNGHLVAGKKSGHYGKDHSSEKGGNWKGNNVKYGAKHCRIYKEKGPAKKYLCVDCNKQAKDWSNVDHQYSLNLDDYVARCRKCHIAYDKLLFT